MKLRKRKINCDNFKRKFNYREIIYNFISISLIDLAIFILILFIYLFLCFVFESTNFEKYHKMNNWRRVLSFLRVSFYYLVLEFSWQNDLKRYKFDPN